MKAFRFPLQRVLDWRGLQLRAEEERLGGLQQKLASLAHQEKALTAAQARSEAAVLGLEAIPGSELQALSGFRLRIRSERATLAAARAQCEAHIAEQRKRLLKARKECRILEQLKEKRHQEWSHASDREIEETAAESYLAGWLRANAEN